jgi:uncharacterized protein involved in exopolysaccharide biosynthesis
LFGKCNAAGTLLVYDAFRDVNHQAKLLLIEFFLNGIKGAIMDSQPQPGSSLRDFLNIIFKRKAQILLFFLITACTVAVGTFLMKPTYEATSKILVKLGRENLYVPTVQGSENNPVIHFNKEEQLNSESEILTSQYIAEQVVKTLGALAIYPDMKSSGGWLSSVISGAEAHQAPIENAVLRLRKNLTVESVKKSNVIEIRFRHNNPAMASNVLNTLVSLFLDRHLEVYKTGESHKFFEEQAAILKRKVSDADDALEAFKKANNIRSLEQERSILLVKEADLRSDMNNTLSSISETRSRINQLKAQLAATPKTISHDVETEQSPYVINTLQTHLIDLQLKEKELIGKYTEKNRLVQNVRAEIKMAREKLVEVQSQRYDRITSGTNPTYNHLQQELYSNQADLRALEAKRSKQQEPLKQYQDRLINLNRIEVRLKDLEEQAEVNRKNHRLYLTKFEESRISDAMDAEKIANVTQIQPATPPIKPVSPKVALNLLLGLFLGAFGGIGLAFFMNYMDDSLDNPERAELAMELPVLVSIPELKSENPRRKT